MPKDKPKKPSLKGKHANRVSFIAVKEQIDGFLREGYSWKAVYEFFVENGTFTMSYITFCRYMNGLVKPVKKRVEANSKTTVTHVTAGSKIPSKTLPVIDKAAKQPVIVAQPKEEDFSDKNPVDPDDVY